MRRWYWLAICVCCIGGEHFGPIPVGDRNPMLNEMLILRAETATTTPAGQWRLATQVGYSNIFEVENHSDPLLFQTVDFEQMVVDVDLRRGLGDAWEVGLHIPLIGRWGGFLDSFIQDWHDFFGLPNDGREFAPNGAYRYFFGSSRVSLVPDLSREPTGLSLGEIRFSAKRVLWRGERTLFSGQTTVKLPTGDDQGSDEVDVALSLWGLYAFGESHLHGGLSLVQIEAPERLAHYIEETSFFGFLSWERAWGDRNALLIQMDAYKGYFQDTGLANLDDPTLNLTLGWMTRLSSVWDGHISFAEDLTGDGPAVDFTLTVGVSRAM